MARGMATMAVVGTPADAESTSTPATGDPEADHDGAPETASTVQQSSEQQSSQHRSGEQADPARDPGQPTPDESAVTSGRDTVTPVPEARSADPGDATAPFVAPAASPAPTAPPAGPTPPAADPAASIGPGSTGPTESAAVASDRPRPRPRPAPAPSEEPAADTSWGAPASPRGVAVAPADPDEAEEFLRLFHAEADEPGATTVKGAASRRQPLDERIAEVRAEIARTGTYVHTSEELTFGARVAWRNSARCIGRLYWRSLHVRDRRDVTAPEDVAAECLGHLDDATRRGRIRSTITILAPDTPTALGPRIWNEQLIRYAGYRTGGRVLGDPRYVGFTDHVRSLGWVPPSPMGRFDVLPLVVTGGGQWSEKGPQYVDVPSESVLEVPLHHPDHAWFADLGLRWHALPVISNMTLDIGGVSYPAAPFNGWYMATEIGARNLADADRYDMLREVAERMGLDTTNDRTMWRDRAAVEITLAVQHSFDDAGVSMADHHGESQRFLRHLEREEQSGRSCPVDWSWIVPPISGGLTPVFHRYYDHPTDTGPQFRMDPQQAARAGGCPM